MNYRFSVKVLSLVILNTDVRIH